MKYLKIIKNTVLLLLVVLFSFISTASHASTAPTMIHEMSRMSHNASDSNSCATQCRTTVFNKEETVDSQKKDDDDHPVVQFYIQNQYVRYLGDTAKEKIYAEAVRPPPKVPIYILYSVFRV